MTRALLLALALAAPAAALEVPALKGRVNDHAGLLSPEAGAALEHRLRYFEERTGHQVAVLTLDSLEGEPLEDFSIKVARAWGLGRKGQNDGVLFLISKSDRKLRIEVGHGLEGAIPDALAGRIIQDTVVPRFQDKRFEGGILAGIDAIIAAADGTYAPPPPAPKRRSASRRTPPADGGLGYLILLLYSAIFLRIVGRLTLLSLTFPPVPSAIAYVIQIPLWGSFPGMIWGAAAGDAILIAFLIAYPLVRIFFGETLRNLDLKDSPFLAAAMSFDGSSSDGGFSGGSDSFGSSSSGSDFSGGGGSFGGGGSSGSW